MGFHDEARKIAQQKQQSQATEAETLSERIDRLFPKLKEQRERVQSDCIEKVLQWFDEIGMLPRPRITAEWALRPIHDPDRYNAQESYFKITWEFEGYKYMASCTSGDSEAWPYIKIWIGARWFYAGTVEAIGDAFLAVEEMDRKNRAQPARHRTQTQMVVLSDTWVGTPGGVGSVHLRKGSIITVDPANAKQIAHYGGSGNLRPLHPDETGDDANHAEPGTNLAHGADRQTGRLFPVPTRLRPSNCVIELPPYGGPCQRWLGPRGLRALDRYEPVGIATSL